MHDGKQWVRTWSPDIATRTDGLALRLLDDARVRVTWSGTPRWTRALVETERGLFEVDVPHGDELAADITLTRGDQVVPLGRDVDGRSVALLVRYDPD